MIKKISIILLSGYLIFILSQSLFRLFEFDVDVASKYKKWAKVLTIKTIKIKQSYRNGEGYSTSWHMTVSVKNNTPKVNLMVGPPPKIGECIPIIVNELTNGNIIASVDITEWRYGTTYGTCE